MDESKQAPSPPTNTFPHSRPIGDSGFIGSFVLGGAVISGSLEVKKNQITLWANGIRLASWKASECKARRLDEDRFLIEADDEIITFTSDDLEGLIRAVSAFPWYQAVLPESATVNPMPSDRASAAAEKSLAAEVVGERVREAPIESRSPMLPPLSVSSGRVGKEPIRDAYDNSPTAPVQPGALPAIDRRPAIDRGPETAVAPNPIRATSRDRHTSVKAHRWLRGDFKDFAIKSGVVSSAVGILTLLGLTFFTVTGGSLGKTFAPIPTTTIPPSPTTTLLVTRRAPPPTTLFETNTVELTDRWNIRADQIGPELTLLTELSTSFLLRLTPFITLEGMLDPASGSVIMRATPTGTPDGDRLIFSSLDLMIGMADPTLDGSDRRALLETLGLAFQDPQLGGLDGTVHYNGLNYHLIYLPSPGALELRITP